MVKAKPNKNKKLNTYTYKIRNKKRENKKTREQADKQMNPKTKSKN